MMTSPDDDEARPVKIWFDKNHLLVRGLFNHFSGRLFKIEEDKALRISVSELLKLCQAIDAEQNLSLNTVALGLHEIKAICFKINQESGSTTQANALDESQFEEFLAEAANRIFFSGSSLPTVILLDKLKDVILEQIYNGGLKELQPYAKTGLKAYRIPLPKGQLQEDGSEKIALEDFKYEFKSPLALCGATTDQGKLEAFAASNAILDELISSVIK